MKTPVINCYPGTRCKRTYLALLVALMLALVLYSIFSQKSHLVPYGSFNVGFVSRRALALPEKIVHLDLKGAAPRPSYLKRLIPLLAQLGVTGLLVEYEDAFPYTDSLRNASARNAYTPGEVRALLRQAAASGLSVIPLVQTFGHLEFVLKLPEFQELREVPELPAVVCPSRQRTLTVVFDMIDQVLRAHPNTTRLHIGADEVWSLGVCDDCFRRLERTGWSKQRLFLDHVVTVCKYVQSRHPQIRTIFMWDDEFRDVSAEELIASGISSLVEPVVWKYTRNVIDDLGSDTLWEVYGQVFKKVWIGSAFKGATGSNKIVTDISHHLDNHRSWLNIVSTYHRQVNFAGIFITGWSRYDHFAVLCELLPVSLPSLATCLDLLYDRSISPLTIPGTATKLLDCEDFSALTTPFVGLPKCTYPGAEILDLIVSFYQFQQDFKRVKDDSQIRGWITDYNIRHRFSNPKYVQSGTNILETMRIQLKQLKIDLNLAMQKVYDSYVIDEWQETYFEPFCKEVELLWNARENLLNRTVWPRRPLQRDILR